MDATERWHGLGEEGRARERAMWRSAVRSAVLSGGDVDKVIDDAEWATDLERPGLLDLADGFR